MTTILVADDDAAFRGAMRVLLCGAGYDVAEAATAAEAIGRFPRAHADVALVDLRMPGDGLELVRALRAATAIPIVVVSGVDDETMVIDALDAGADDYVRKPFTAGELLARLRAALRHRTVPAAGAAITVGPLVLDPAGRTATLSGRGLELTPTEFDVLRTLAEQPEGFLPTRELLRRVWGPGYEAEATYVRAYVHRLRRKFEEAGLADGIAPEPGAGYRLALPAKPAAG